jgi:hypothetical protein
MWCQAIAQKGENSMSPNENVRITIAADKSQYKPGEEIKLSISLENASAQPVTIVQRSHWLNHILSVVDAQGRQLAERPEAAAVKSGAEAGFRAVRQLASGEVLKEELSLNQLFNLEKPGVYKVKSRRNISATKAFEKPLAVESNEITLQVVK